MAQLVTVITADGKIDGTNVTFNYGATTPIATRTTTTSPSLWKCDISAIPAGSTITRVRIARNVTNAGSTTGPPNYDHTCSRILRAYTEGTGNAAASGNGATWNTYDGSNNWTTAGGTGEGTDILAADGWTFERPSATGVHTQDSDAKAGMLTFFQTTLDSYSGIAIWREHASGGLTGQSYDSRTGTTPPVITIDYTEPAPAGPTAAQKAAASGVRGRGRGRTGMRRVMG